MKTAAAKGKSLFSLAALCLALAAVPAQAARLLPSPPRLDAAPHITELVDLDEPLSPQAQGLPLFTLEDHWLVTVLSVVDVPEPGALLPRNRYRLFAESQSLPPPVRAALIAKLASGPQTWPDAPISLGRIDLEEKSHRLFFQGLWTDPTTGLAYARNRWYDPHNAAWLSEDPIGPVDSPNLYAFVGWGPNSGTDPMGLGDDWAVGPFSADAAAIEKANREKYEELLKQHRLNPGMYSAVGSSGRGRLYYFLSQALPGTDEEGTTWHPFAGASQASVDLRAYKREHSKEAFGLDILSSLAGPEKGAKVFGLVAAGMSYAEREQQAAEWAGRARVLTENEAALSAEGRHVMTRLQQMTNEAEDLLDTGKAASPAAQRYYAAQSKKKWWAFFMRGQALQSEIEGLRAQAATSDAILAQVEVRPRLFGLIPDFVYTQATGERVILDVTSPRAFTLGKALKYAKEAQDIIIELYHRGRGMPK